MEANIDVQQALSTAIDNEGDDASDVVFNEDDDAQLVIYVMVYIATGFTFHSDYCRSMYFFFEIHVSSKRNMNMKPFWISNNVQLDVTQSSFLR